MKRGGEAKPCELYFLVVHLCHAMCSFFFLFWRQWLFVLSLSIYKWLSLLIITG